MIKKLLVEALCLALLDFDKLFEVECNVSKTSIDVVLTQEKMSITFFSEKHLGFSSRYSIYDVEFYAVVCVFQFGNIITCQKLYSNHEALKYLNA